MPDGISPIIDRRQEIADRLRDLLSRLFAARPEPSDVAIDKIALDTEFTNIGMNSVDYLEFVITVEREFDVDLPDEAFTEKMLFSLSAWADYLAAQADG